jgi:hypothetical protein
MSGYIYIGEGGSGYVFATYWQATSSASGTVSLPTGATVQFDAFQDLEDAVVSTVTSDKPDFNAAVDGAGTRCVATFDISGNYSISPVPSSYPVAIIYRVIIQESNINYSTDPIVLEDIHRPGGGGSGTVTGGDNVGTGAEVFKDLNGGDLRFRSIVGDGITVVQGTNEITISQNTYNPGGW